MYSLPAKVLKVNKKSNTYQIQLKDFHKMEVYSLTKDKIATGDFVEIIAPDREKSPLFRISSKMETVHKDTAWTWS